MSRKYEIHSGRRVVKTVLSSSPLQAAIDYVHTFGSASTSPRLNRPSLPLDPVERRYRRQAVPPLITGSLPPLV